jgi:preprotein translocase subunit SecD
MFTAIIVTRVLANFVYERNINLKAKKLHIWKL